MSEASLAERHTFLVNEIYPCLQGEGLNLGMPSLLVRFQICNLRCTWCDTPYTHTFASDPSPAELSESKVEPKSGRQKQKYKRLKCSELVSEIHSFGNLKHLILSGGEPTLQNLALIMNSLGPAYTAEVETNGTRIPHLSLPGFSVADYARFQWNISPKGENAGQKYELEALQHWAELALKQENVFFKFVVRETECAADLLEIENLQALLRLQTEKIFLMAEGTSVESQVANTWLHDLCLTKGYRYTPRLHVLLFGSKRGV